MKFFRVITKLPLPLLFLTILTLVSNDLKSQLACNNSVQISLKEGCEVTVTPDMILKGNYPDYSIYEVQIEGIEGSTVTTTGVFSVTVVDLNTRNSCWSEIQVEDKLGTSLFCQDIEIPCVANADPGTPIEKRVTIKGTLSSKLDTIAIHFSALELGQLSKVQSVVAELQIEHGNISELGAILVSPQNKRIQLFDSIQYSNPHNYCLKQDLTLALDQSSTWDYNSLVNDYSQCRINDAPSIFGKYQPKESLDTYKGDPARGNWTILLYDTEHNSNQPKVVDATLKIGVNDGSVTMPFAGAVEFEKISDTHYRISGGSVCGSIVASYTDNLTQGCSEDNQYYGEIARYWSVEDESGNISNCTQNIKLLATQFDDVLFPPNYDDYDNPSFNCYDEFHGELEPNGAPSPSVTGMPYTLDNPDGGLCGNMRVSYKDVKIDLCENSFKLLRTWTIINWCASGSANVIDSTQVIAVVDNTPPAIACPMGNDTIVELRHSFNCEIDLEVPPPTIISECSDYTWTVQYKHSNKLENCTEPTNVNYSSKGVTTVDDKVFIKEMTAGCLWVKYIVTDGCGNTSTEVCELKLVDKTPPVAVCDETTVVSLGPDGTATVKAESFDENSQDNCSEELIFTARKLSGECHIDSIPQSEIHFCCAELGEVYMVELTVEDQSGNKNFCMVEATVQNKFPIILQCPDSVTVDCDVDHSDLLDKRYGEPEVHSNCDESLLSAPELIYDINNCGSGIIYKEWRLYGFGKDSSETSCRQTFYVRNNQEIEGDSIKFPEDVLIVSCTGDTDVDNTGSPEVPESACNLLAVTHEDLYFDNAVESCEKIIREWTVIDWCQYQPEIDDSKGIWVNNQIIRIQNSVAPEFTDECEDEVVCSNVFDCTGEITLTKSATDDCTPSNLIKWALSIDYDNDGTIDFTTRELVRDGAEVNYDLSDVSINTVHRAIWRATDGCGNIATCDYEFEIIDCKPPTPICLSNIVTTIMPQAGSVDIWASDFNFKSEDNCTIQRDLKYSFSSDTTDQSLRITCADLDGQNELVRTVRVYVTDRSGQQDYCTGSFHIQDNSSVCSDSDNGGDDGDDDGDGENGNPNEVHTISGLILNRSSQPIDGTQVRIMSNQPEYPRTLETDNNGRFTFDDVKGSFDYQITPAKNDDMIKGITTLDIVLLQRHLLGLQRFTVGLQTIAADADNNEKITISDAVAIRKLLLGRIEALPNGQQSWRYVNKKSIIYDPLQPFPFEESSSFANLDKDGSSLFTGIKIGDINGDVESSLQQDISIRSQKHVPLQIKSQLFGKDEWVEVEVSIPNSAIVGIQNKWNYETAVLDFHSIKPLDIEVTEEYVEHRDGTITLSWSQARPIAAQTLFKLVFKAKKGGSIEDVLSLDKQFQNEIYDDKLEPKTNDLMVIDQTEIPQGLELEVYQNNPNPFDGHTSIGFKLAKNDQIRLTIFDVSGRTILERTQFYNAGYHEISISDTDLNQTGILYYSISNSSSEVTKKMISLE